MTQEFSFLAYFFQAGFFVKFIMLILFGMSIASWTVIINRALQLKRDYVLHCKFNTAFEKGLDLAKHHSGLKARKGNCSGLESIFNAGFEAFNQVKTWERCTQTQAMAFINQAMYIASQKSRAALSNHLPFLATVASISPFIGLLGTVWGIMTTFHALSGATQANIAMVAPGIAEALIATAMGLVAAIPAAFAYNRLSQRIEQYETDYDIFCETFMHLLSKQWYISK